ncbi:hypothetical protein LOTGIDRAFT_197037 [Lottia gigantea]|uniref:Strictosidine synthase conserved region domain-containing protein n=1 Tax=Lottia gigantea TaxID=225164 RepID=V3ZMC1_LOTGI|nr:hypothetical protein LOTGIDRAFT_197037 [Lottia gigantea]ESO83595.1 hypothetical protein LOTGIDRAFT_197037 [Lottia gigantea]
MNSDHKIIKKTKFNLISVPYLSCCVLLIAVVIVYFIPSPIDPKPFLYKHPLPQLKGPLAVNQALERVDKLFENQVIGPESFTADQNGFVYTGSADGKIWRFKDGQLEMLARTGINNSHCGSFELEPECGRPKGMKIDKNGDLVLVDAYKGLLKVNLQNKNIEVLVRPDTDQLREPLRFLNGLAITSDGMIFFTDSSTKWDRRNYRYEVIETNSYGRLLSFNPTTDQVKVVLEGLYLANGLVLSQDESYLLIVEMTVSRIIKYHLTGSRAGEREVFIENLPGYPDNIQLNSAGNYFVGMGSVKFEGSSRLGPFLDNIGPYPWFKRFLAKVTPRPLFDVFLPRHAMLVEISPKGKIAASYHDPTGSVVRGVGEGYQHGVYIYIGHFSMPFVGRIEIDKLNKDAL